MFTISGTEFTAIINKATKLIGKTPDILTLENTKARANHLTLVGHDSGRFITHTFSAKNVKGNFKIGVPVDRITAISNKRTELVFKPADTGGSLYYESSSSAYKGHIETLEVRTIQTPVIDLKNSSLMDDALKEILFNMVSLVALDCMFETIEMMLFISIKDKEFQISSADNFHAALVETIGYSFSNEKAKTYILPFRYVSAIASIFSAKEKISLCFAKAHLHVFNDYTTISLPLVGGQASVTREDIVKLITNAENTNSKTEFSVDLDSVKICLSNMDGIKDEEKGSELLLTVNSNYLTMRMSSRHGSISDRIDIASAQTIKNKDRLALESKTVNDTFGKIEGICKMKFIDGKLLLLTGDRNKYKFKYVMVAVTDRGENDRQQ